MLRHENIVQLKQAFRREGKLSLVFEFVDMNLLQLLELRPGGLPEETVCKIVHQLTKAIAYCHRNDVVHRDIKLENLLINRNDNCLKLCDFGFARTLPSRDTPLTDYVATRWYRAPEILVGVVRYGKEVDVWAIGCITGELFDGQPMFPGQSEIDQLFLIQKSLGPLTPEQQAVFLKNPRFDGVREEISRSESLDSRYLGKASKRAMGFLKSFLLMEPKSRATAEAACADPWFEPPSRAGKIVMNLPRQDIGGGEALPPIPPPVCRWPVVRRRPAPRAVGGVLELTGRVLRR